MKRLFGCFLVPLLLSATPLLAETAPEHVEKIERMSRDIETLIASNAELQRRLSEATDEINRLRQEQSRNVNDTAVQAVREDLRQLAEKVQEVDRKRIADKDTIAKEVERSFEKIEKLLKQNSGGGGSSSARPTPARTPDKPIPSEGFEYVVKSGDTLSRIVVDVNGPLKEQGLKPVTLQQLLDANPNLKPERMKVGDKVFIPAYK